MRTFDALAYFEQLKAVGVPEDQAKVQANALRDLCNNDIVTKEYLDGKLNALELRLLKWQIGVALTLAAIMAKGFGWIGF